MSRWGSIVNNLRVLLAGSILQLLADDERRCGRYKLTQKQSTTNNIKFCTAMATTGVN